jgi:hypothetical protein
MANPAEDLPIENLEAGIQRLLLHVPTQTSGAWTIIQEAILAIAAAVDQTREECGLQPNILPISAVRLALTVNTVNSNAGMPEVGQGDK